MTTAAQLTTMERADVRTLVGGGAVLGVVAAVGVAIFSLASRATTGTTETVVQSALLLVGAGVFAYFPATRVRARSTDFIAWAALLGLLGALFFTVFDAALLRRLALYHWTWDEIGGGSGFWYIPVWWMGSALLAWFGAWIAAEASESTAPLKLATMTAAIALALTVILVVTNVMRFHAATVALASGLALPIHLGIAKVMRSA